MKPILLLVAALGFSSCSTLLTSPKDRQTTISSSKEMDVYENGRRIGSTPFLVERLGKDRRSLSVRKDGYRSIDLTLISRTRPLYEFLGVMGLGIPLVVDAVTGALHQSMTPEVMVTPFREFKNPEVSVVLNDLDYLVLDGTRLCEKDKKIIFKKTKYQDMDVLNWSIESVEKSRFNIVNRNKSGSLDFNKTYKGRLHLTPEVEKIKYIKSSQGYFYCEMSINWKFEQNDKTIENIRIEASNFSPATNYKNALKDCILLNYLKLQEDDSFFEKISKSAASADSIQALPVGEIVTLSKLAPPKYADRKEKIKRFMESTVTIITEDGFGSGFFISPEGYLITNEHVVDKNKTVDIKLNSGIKLKGQVIKVHPEADLALIKVVGEGFTWLPVGTDDDIVVGDEVFAVGTPEDQSLSSSVTRGILSAKRKDEKGKNYFQSDASINSGNSGGPLLNADGKVIGVNVAKIKKTGVEGISFSIPINTVISTLNIEFK